MLMASALKFLPAMFLYRSLDCSYLKIQNAGFRFASNSVGHFYNLNYHVDPFHFTGDILKEEVQIPHIMDRNFSVKGTAGKKQRTMAASMIAYKDKCGDLYRLVFKGNGEATYARIVKETTRLKDHYKELEVMAGAARNFPDNWEKLSNASTRLFTNTDLNIFGKYISLDLLDSTLWSQGKDSLSWNEYQNLIGGIAKHIITEERQLTKILADVLRSRICSISPHTVVTSSKVLVGATQPAICEFSSIMPDLCVFNSVERYVSSENVPGSKVNGASIVFDSLTSPVIGASLECKRQKLVYIQTIANMVKLGADLSLNLLRTGQVLESVDIFGVAINCIDNTSKLLELKVNFRNEQSLIMYENIFTIADALNYVCHRILKNKQN